jgi:hypothetical protein
MDRFLTFLLDLIQAATALVAIAVTPCAKR